jgi:phage recombination protein Bet
MSEFNYTDAELKALKNQYAKDASEEQFLIWMAECRQRGLVPVKDVVLQMRATKEWNPETRQKEFVKKAVHITTIQALRKLAERTGKYAGQLPSIWIYLDSNGQRVESDIPLPEANGSKNPKIPWAAKVSVLRKGFEQPITVPARFEAYAQYYSADNVTKLNSTWANRGPEQLEKCAEALALRKAFPEELGGLYLQEEFTDEETVAATAQPSTENGSNAPNLPANTTVGNLPAETKKKGRPKKESVPDAGKPWGGEFEKKPDQVFTGSDSYSKSGQSVPTVHKTDEPATDGQPNIHGVVIEDDEIPFPGDPEPPVNPGKSMVGENPARLATEAERKDFMKRLIVLKDKGFTGIREFLLKESGVQITNDIPVARMNELVARLEVAESEGKLKELLGGK